jgi:protein TonB
VSAVLTANDGLSAAPLRWPLSFTLAAALHVGAVLAAFHWHAAVPPAPPPPVVVTIERAPSHVVPPAPPRPIPPRPKHALVQPPARAPLEPPIVPRVLPARAPAVDVPPAPKVAALPHVEAPAPAIIAPAAIDVPLVAEAAPVATEAPRATVAPALPASNAVPAWQGLLLGRLERFKRYPSSAQFRRQQGVVYLRFSMDRHGNVVSAVIDKSSGFDILDAEALALIHRAAPLPPPPPEVDGDPIELVVPIQFFLNR